MSDPAANRALVVKAITELFIDGDASAIDRYWGDPAGQYINHNPQTPNGRDGMRAFLAAVGPLTYQVGMVAAAGDIVMVHGRYERPDSTAVIAVDMFRVKDGRIVEHWDVLQDEVTDTVNGNPMFTVPAAAGAAA
jgi:predicted SnoaL-like aldol condensation-catalyzing enzyme